MLKRVRKILRPVRRVARHYKHVAHRAYWRGLPPLMSPEEAVLYSTLLDRSNALIEYGCGGSTLMAVRRRVRRIVSVETDPSWLEKMRNVRPIGSAEKHGQLSLVHCDVGPVGDVGHPIDLSASDRYHEYPSRPWLLLKTPDLVFVDGRFRVSCALESLQHMRDDTLLAFHDFWDRDYYQVILPFTVLQARAGTLRGVFDAPAQIGPKRAHCSSCTFTMPTERLN